MDALPYPPNQPRRRDFLRRGSVALATAIAATGAAGFVPATRAADDKAKPAGDGQHNRFCTFTKWLQMKNFDEVAEIIAGLGFDGVEAPVRPGGHVLPENVATDLPKMVAAFARQDLELMVLTSGINAVNQEQHTETVLKTAADLGVERFRMAYYKYDLKKPIAAQLETFQRDLDALVALCAPLGIKPIYQNHSGSNYVGAPLWDLHQLFKNHDPAQVGAAFDIGHATVEGAKSWIIDFNLLRPWIDTVYIKEPIWVDNELEWGPGGEGIVSDTFFSELKRTDFRGPISLHVEYLGHKDPDMVPTITEATRKDFATLKNRLAAAKA